MHQVGFSFIHFVSNYHHSLRNSPEEPSCLLLRCRSLKSCIATASCFMGLKRARCQGEHPVFMLRISSCNVRLPCARACVCVCVCVWSGFPREGWFHAQGIYFFWWLQLCRGSKAFLFTPLNHINEASQKVASVIKRYVARMALDTAGDISVCQNREVSKFWKSDWRSWDSPDR
jgi:hypothetical protein